MAVVLLEERNGPLGSETDTVVTALNFGSADEANLDPAANPVSRTHGYSYEKWVRLHVESLAGANRVDNFKVWMDNGSFATGEEIVTSLPDRLRPHQLSEYIPVDYPDTGPVNTEGGVLIIDEGVIIGRSDIGRASVDMTDVDLSDGLAVSFWVYLQDDYFANDRGIVIGPLIAHQTNNWRIDITGSASAFGAGNVFFTTMGASTGSGIAAQYSASNRYIIPLNQWVHIFVVVHVIGEETTGRFYIDGDLIGNPFSIAYSGVQWIPAMNELTYIGNRPNDTAQFQGLLADIAVYNTTITSGYPQWYIAGIRGDIPTEGIVARWPMDAVVSDMLLDSVGTYDADVFGDIVEYEPPTDFTRYPLPTSKPKYSNVGIGGQLSGAITADDQYTDWFAFQAVVTGDTPTGSVPQKTIKIQWDVS